MKNQNISINNSYFSIEDVQIIMLIIWGLTEKQIADIINCKTWEVKRSKSSSFDKLGVDKVPMLAAKALEFDFKLKGTFRGEKLFTPAHIKKVLLIKPILGETLKD